MWLYREDRCPVWHMLNVGSKHNNKTLYMYVREHDLEIIHG